MPLEHLLWAKDTEIKTTALQDCPDCERSSVVNGRLCSGEPWAGWGNTGYQASSESLNVA